MEIELRGIERGQHDDGEVLGDGRSKVMSMFSSEGKSNRPFCMYCCCV